MRTLLGVLFRRRVALGCGLFRGPLECCGEGFRGRFAFLRAGFERPGAEAASIRSSAVVMAGFCFGAEPALRSACSTRRSAGAGSLEAFDDVGCESEADMDLCRFGLRAAHLLEGFHRVDEIGHDFPDRLHVTEVLARELAHFALFVGERPRLPRICRRICRLSSSVGLAALVAFSIFAPFVFPCPA